MDKQVLMEEMIWHNIEKAMEDGTETVIIPVGNDALELAAVKAAEELGNVLVAPTIKVELLGEQLLRPETVTKMLNKYCDSLAGQAFQPMLSGGKGFTRLFLVPNHKGYFEAVNKSVALKSQEMKNVKIVAPTKVDTWRKAIETKRPEDMATFLVAYIKETI
jgi:creatinine amidohydrolase